MSPLLSLCPVMTRGFPRVSGDEPWIADAWRERIPFSPRERG